MATFTDPQAALRLPAGYTRRYSPADGGVYWHLFCDGTRVNGGLSAGYQSAGVDARYFALQHYWTRHPGERDHGRLLVSLREDFTR